VLRQTGVCIAVGLIPTILLFIDVLGAFLRLRVRISLRLVRFAGRACSRPAAAHKAGNKQGKANNSHSRSALSTAQRVQRFHIR
jgi:hypothetical protein